MQVFTTTFTAVAMLLTIGILGYWLLSRRVLAGPVIGSLSALAINIALPCMTFSGIIANFHPEENTGWWSLPLWWLGMTALFAALTFICSAMSAKQTRREFRVALLFQNGIFFPIAIISEIFGPASPMLVDLFLFMLFFPAFFFSFSPLFFSHGLKIDPLKVFNPVLISTLVAVLIRYAGFDSFLPKFLTEGVRMVGAMTVPLLMLVLGGNIYIDMKGSGRPAYLENLKFVLAKNIVFPVAALGAIMALRPPESVAFIIMIQASVPPITAAPIIVEREGGDRNIVNQFMVSSFLLSLVSLPAMLAFFSALYSR